jgi:hypothetical protein
VTNLELFAAIRVGDIVTMPANREQYDVHFGVVVPGSRELPQRGRSAPYYYHFDINKGDWFENAHRIPVRWHRETTGQWAVLSTPELGGVWLKGFGRIDRARDTLIRAAKKAGFDLSV